MDDNSMRRRLVGHVHCHAFDISVNTDIIPNCETVSPDLKAHDERSYDMLRA